MPLARVRRNLNPGRESLKIPRVGDEFSILDQDRMQRTHERALCQEGRGVFWTLKDNLEGPGAKAGRRAQDAAAARLDPLVNGQELFRGL